MEARKCDVCGAELMAFEGDVCTHCLDDGIPDDIPRLSDPFRDPKLSWMRSK